MRALALLAGLAAAIAFSATASAGVPHTTSLLMHPSAADLSHLGTVLNGKIRRIHLGKTTTLDVRTKCRTAAPAINARGLGYRHVICGFAGPGLLAIHGSVTFSLRGSTLVYAGRICALGVCSAMHG